MNAVRPKLCRARPKLDYAPPLIRHAQSDSSRKAGKSGNGMQFIRCGGGFRIVRRDKLPGEDRCSF